MPKNCDHDFLADELAENFWGGAGESGWMRLCHPILSRTN